MSDDVIQCFVEHCLTDPFHHLQPAAAAAADIDVSDDVLPLCEAVFSGLGEVAQLPRDCLSTTLHSLIVSTLTSAYQLLPTPRQVWLRLSVCLEKQETSWNLLPLKEMPGIDKMSG